MSPQKAAATPTIRAIASATGFAKTTVALALKDSTAVAVETRKKIQSVAREMGYKTDAHISQLMGYLSQRNGQRSLCNLGWLNTSENKNEWRDVPCQYGLLQGAETRALELGYVIDDIWAGEPGFRLDQLPNLLRARGIEGLLIPEMINGEAWEKTLLDCVSWKDLHVVTVADPRNFQMLHQVRYSMNYNMQVVLHEITRLGYQRPALVTDHFHDHVMDYGISGPFLAYHELYYPRERLEPFWMESGWNLQKFRTWFDAQRPDVLLVTNNQWRQWLTDIGIRVPQDVGLAHLKWGLDVKDWAGVNVQREVAGGNAVDLLTAHLFRGERGWPAQVKEVHVRGCWENGTTLRVQ